MPIIIDYIHDDDGLGWESECECDGCAAETGCDYDQPCDCGYCGSCGFPDDDDYDHYPHPW